MSKQKTNMTNAKKVETNIYQYNQKKVADILVELAVTEDGLTVDEAQVRLDENGVNELSSRKEENVVKILYRSFINPFSLILIVLAIISWLTDFVFTTPAATEDQSDVTFIVILLMVFISGLLHFVQEYRANKSAASLQKMIDTTVSVRRQGVVQEILAEEIVRGDIVMFNAGDAIPADVKFIETKDLFVGQSALNGESMPIEKHVIQVDEPDTLFDAATIGFMGTAVISGVGSAVVLATGDQTYFGQISQYMIANKNHDNAFSKGVSDVGKILIRMMLVVLPFVFLINGVLKQEWLDAFLFALSIAVGLTPEMLPMIMSASLAKGSVTMANKKVIVKKMDAIQSLGAMNVLCTDKTGTLTEDKIIVQKYFNVLGEEDEHVLRYAYLNSYFQTGLKNLLDVAIIDYASGHHLIKNAEDYHKIDEIPFDFERRRMSVVVKGKKGTMLITKGATEEILKCAKYAYINGEVVELNDELVSEFMMHVTKLNNEGMRVLTVAYKVLDKDSVFSVEDESDMVVDGFIALFDAPKESAKSAIAHLHNQGVEVKIITGDNLPVAHTVAQYIGLEVGSENELQGNQIERLSFEELKQKVAQVNIFAKVTPMQKADIVKALQENNNTVGFLGDGINDAAALDRADIGISVDTAVDIAREHADIVLLEKDLEVINEGVVEGRRIFININKYIQMAASGNFGNIFTVLISSIFLPFLPMLPIQILLQNLLYDFSQSTIPWDNVDESILQKPQNWSPGNLQRFMVIVGPISSIFDILTFVILWFIIKANNIELASVFQTGWFTVGVLTQLISVYILRTEKINIFKTRPPKIMVIASVVVAAIALYLPYSPFAAALKLTVISPVFYLWVVLILLGYVISLTICKKWYINKFGQWL